ncbi:hypothetical protein NEMBOFW57_001358 [Staphylotrichum longicolle]|uniref:2EXR domain-containing protein n=1 Tax=Staphylotrichum longicolle TaxID=669026 RepID=A0AAD4F121_9PEZI|nr:hypothetical protein NEMBOFW57_001358 [Staphylotrichum longicolle]
MSFNSLPLEIKQTIWQLALHAAVDEPEVCIVWPIKTGGYDPISKPFLVDTAFPVLMHVCGQWREFVLSSCQQPSSPVKFRFSRQANCRVPYRHFRPSTDILYSSSMNHEEAIKCHLIDWEPGVPRTTLAAVRHLAVDWPLWMDPMDFLPELVFRACPDLEKVSVVFPSSRQAIWSCFKAPAKRCKLRRVEGADELSAVRDWDEEKVLVSMQWQVDEGAAILDEDAQSTWQNELHIHEHTMGEPGGGWFVGTAWDKKREKFCLEYEPAAFVQYKRSENGDETWVEGCEDRLIEWVDCWKNPGTLEPSPEQLAISPEEWRVNDEDGYKL